MPFEAHERAQWLIDESRVAGISEQDAAWLRTHLSECVACAHQEEMTSRMLGAMTELSFEASDRQAVWPVQRTNPRRWPVLAAAAIILLAVGVPVWKHKQDARRRDEADTWLLERVGNHVSRTVPTALEPLMQHETGDHQ